MTIENRLKAIEQLQRKAEKSFKEAELLLEQSFYEAAISRAYYSMFYLAQAVLATKDLSRRKHSGVISVFREQFTKTGLISKDLSYKIGKAFEERQAADYETAMMKTEEEARGVLSYAQDFFKEIIPFLQNWIEEQKD